MAATHLHMCKMLAVLAEGVLGARVCIIGQGCTHT